MVYPSANPYSFEDPEEVAERELSNAAENSKDSNGIAKPLVTQNTNRREPPVEDVTAPISIGSQSTSGSAPGSLKKTFGSFKEAKAERKKRSRGVSGSSIKKDGGKFDHDYQDEYYGEAHSDDDEDFFLKNGEVFDGDDFPYEDLGGFSLKRLCELLEVACWDPELSNLQNINTYLVNEVFQDEERLFLLGKAVALMVENVSTIFSKVSEAEYHISIVLARIVKDLFGTSSIVGVVIERLNGGSQADAYAASLLSAAKEFIDYEAEELKGSLSEVPHYSICDSFKCEDRMSSAHMMASLADLKIFHRLILTYALSDQSVSGVDSYMTLLYSIQDLSKDTFATTVYLALDYLLANGLPLNVVLDFAQTLDKEFKIHLTSRINILVENGCADETITA